MSTIQSTAQTKAETTTASSNDLSTNQISPVESRTETQFAIRPTGAAEKDEKGKTAETKPETKKGYSEELLKKIDEFKNSLSSNKDEIITILKDKFGQGVTEARMQKAVSKLDAEMKSNPGDDKWVKNTLVWGGIALIEKIEEKYGEFTKKNFLKYLEDRSPKVEKKDPVNKKAEQPQTEKPQAEKPQTEKKPETDKKVEEPKPTQDGSNGRARTQDSSPKPSEKPGHSHAPSDAERAKAEKLNNTLKIPEKYTTESDRLMYRDNHGLDAEAARAFEEMKRDAAKRGVRLEIISDYRGYEAQHQNLKGKLSHREMHDVMEFNMPVGYSQHHTGRAIDVKDPTRPDTDVKQSFDSTPAYKYLKENAGRFGFSFPYPKGGADGIGYEPWHIFYEGKK